LTSTRQRPGLPNRATVSASEVVDVPVARTRPGHGRESAMIGRHPRCFRLAGVAIALAGFAAAGCKSSAPPPAAPGTDAAPGSVVGADGSAPVAARDLGRGRCVAINSRGDVVGVDADDTTFVVTSDGMRTPRPPPDSSTTAIGVAIDDSGRIAGYVTGPMGNHAAIYRDGAWSLVSNLGRGSEILAATAKGTLGGAAYRSDGKLEAFLLVDGKPAPMSWPSGGSAVYAATDGGHIAGILATATGATHAFVGTGQTLSDLGTLGGLRSAAYGMNARGDVVGTSEMAGGGAHPFVARAGTLQMVDLGLPDGASSSDARGIDAAGNIVGNSIASNGLSRAWVFRPGLSPVELPASDASGIRYASVHVAAISAKGQAVGWGMPAPSDAGATFRCLEWSVTGP
jgi:probable HAF family extracellular repeat protein